MYSRFESSSLITYIAEHPGTYTLPSNSTPILSLYKKIYDITGGKVTPLIGTLMEDVGYDAAYSLSPQKSKRPVPSWDTIFSPDLQTMTTNTRVMLDIGAAGKGYLVDLVAAVLHTHDIHDYTIDAGADILHMRSGKPAEPLIAALESPFDTTLALGTVPIHNQSLCASASNRRAWSFGDKHYHHIIDPTTGKSVEHVAATWVLAHDALHADMLATALFFTPARTLATHFSFEYVVVYTDGSFDISPAWPGEMFT